ncbi:MAG: anaerobic ribonucleoside-triphosphate reductase activating protein [Bacteroidaceae bacterium]|nr:anaerobic ribonucleoside-triphosphate reductase activating protein [Bacteroidaceae bacterium]
MLRYAGTDIVFQEFPDEVTLAINITGCPNNCPGCHSPYLREDAGPELDDVALLSLIADYRGEITCVGLMGGDGDPQSVMHLCDTIRLTYGDTLRTGWYSGRERLPQGFRPELFDYVKLGPFVEAAGPLSSPHTNQRMYRIHDGKLHDITHRFRKR